MIAKMKVIFISEWFDNPYKKLLSKHLSFNNIQVEELNKNLFFLHRILLDRQKSQIIHFQTIHCFLVSQNILFSWLKFLLFTFQIACLRLLSIKTVWTVHEWQDKISKNKQKSIGTFRAKILGKLIDAVITHCDSTKKLIEQELSLENSEKVFVIPHGNYISWYENKITPTHARRALNLEANKFVFLIFGGIHRGKGILEAIAAFKQLPQTGISLIIAGKNGSIKVRDAIKQEIATYTNIKLIAPEEGIPDTEVQNYLNACDCLLLPYKIFTTSGVALLGMSFGKTCIAPNSGFFQDIFQNGGAFLYHPEQIDGLQKAMRNALENKNLLSAMGAKNLQLAQEWNWDFVAKQTTKIYQWCLPQ
jgi:beta-1,4-mannosyltransferase